MGCKMTFLRHDDDIINLERVTRIYKEENICEAIPSGIVTIYRVVLAGDDQKIEIKCDSEEEADNVLSTIEELLKKLYGLYKYTEISDDNGRRTR